MAIENLEPIQNTGLATQESIFQSNNIIIAGKLTMKHPLMDETLLLAGFVCIGCSYFNQENFFISGNKIHYLDRREEEEEYIKATIYPKILLDNKTNPCFKYLINNDHIRFLSSSGYYYCDRKKEIEYGPNSWPSLIEKRFDIYLYENINSKSPEYITDFEEVFALCKYRVENQFKYEILPLNELIIK